MMDIRDMLTKLTLLEGSGVTPGAGGQGFKATGGQGVKPTGDLKHGMPMRLNTASPTGRAPTAKLPEADVEEGNKFTGELAKARAAGKKQADLDGDGDLEPVKEAKKAKPDFLDVDKDGNKTEPFKKAVRDKASKKSVKENLRLVRETALGDRQIRVYHDREYREYHVCVTEGATVVSRQFAGSTQEATDLVRSIVSEARGMKVAWPGTPEYREKTGTETRADFRKKHAGSVMKDPKARQELEKLDTEYEAGKGRYGKEEEPDDEEGKKQAKPAGEKRGRGRPKGTKRSIGAKGPTGRSKLMTREDYDEDMNEDWRKNLAALGVAGAVAAGGMGGAQANTTDYSKLDPREVQYLRTAAQALPRMPDQLPAVYMQGVKQLEKTLDSEARRNPGLASELKSAQAEYLKNRNVNDHLKNLKRIADRYKVNYLHPALATKNIREQGVGEAKTPGEFVKGLVGQRSQYKVGDWITVRMPGYASDGMTGKIVELYTDSEDGTDMAKVAVGGANRVQKQVGFQGGPLDLPRGVRTGGTTTTVPLDALELYTQGVAEDYDRDEYDEEGEMAKSQSRTIADAAQELQSMISDQENLPEWVQKKISLAQEYIDSARDYLEANRPEDSEEEMPVPEGSTGDYSAKKARAGKDIGKPGKQFSKIAKSAGERYGSKKRGEKVAGAVLAKLRKGTKESTDQLDEISSDLANAAAREAERTGQWYTDDGKPRIGYEYMQQADRLQAGADKRRAKERDRELEKTLSSGKRAKMKKESSGEDREMAMEKMASKSQNRLMRATAGGADTGVSKKVAREFIRKSHGQKVGDLPEKVREVDTGEADARRTTPSSKEHNDEVFANARERSKKEREGHEKAQKEKPVKETTTAGSVATAPAEGSKKSKGGIQFGKGIYEAQLAESFDAEIARVLDEGTTITINSPDNGDASVSINGTGEDAMALANLLKMAGLFASDGYHSACSSCGQVHEGDCRVMEEDLANSADNTETMSTDYMVNGLSGGLNGPKQQVNPNNMADNPLAMKNLGKAPSGQVNLGAIAEEVQRADEDRLLDLYKRIA